MVSFLLSIFAFLREFCLSRADQTPGIDMVIEYMLQNFDRKMVELGCEGLSFEVEGRSQFYKKPLVNLV